MKNNYKLLAAFTIVALPSYVHAFDINTHAAMTSAAIQQSKITGSPNSSVILKKLGVYDKDFAIGSSYVDIGSLIKRNTTQYEGDVVDEVGKRLTLPAIHTIPGWIIRGSIREDDNTKETLQGTPEGDEPNGVFDRVYGHFFDPVNNRGLTVAGLTLGPRSPEWATLKDVGVTGFGFGSRQNYYNLPSAREAMWRALTLKEWNNGTPIDAAFPGNWPYSTKTQLRDAYWATMFRAIGDMVHLLQDAGQPQHTRNDAHSGYGCVAYTSACAGGHASFFENYLKARTLGTGQFTLDEGFSTVVAGSGLARDIVPKQLDYCCYGPPTFTKAEDFFSTATGGGNASGRGLANYSSRGFYSFGTNIASTLDFPLPSPPPFGEGLTPIVLTGDSVIPENRLRNMAGDVLNSSMTFLTGTVVDSIGGGNATNVKLATAGAWDQFLIAKSILPKYTLNYYNYDDQAKLLIPRAVGYSAGLIDYFFRGQMEISLPDDGIYAIADHSDPAVYTKDTGGFKKLKLKITNRTPNIVESGTGTISEQKLDATGKVVAVVKFVRNKCYRADDLKGEWAYLEKIGQSGKQILDACYFVNGQLPDEEIVVSDPVQLGATLAKDGTSNDLTFNFPTAIPINAVSVYLQVVYRGILGNEQDAVVVETKDIAEPSFMSFSVDTDYEEVFTDRTCKVFDRAIYYPPGSTTLSGYTAQYEIYFTQTRPTPKVATMSVTAGQRSRLAILPDKDLFVLYQADANNGGVVSMSAEPFVAINQVQNNGDNTLSLSILPKARWPQLRGSFWLGGYSFNNSRALFNTAQGTATCGSLSNGDLIQYLPAYNQPDPKPIPTANIVF
jgi:hypothetical protein